MALSIEKNKEISRTIQKKWRLMVGLVILTLPLCFILISQAEITSLNLVQSSYFISNISRFVHMLGDIDLNPTNFTKQEKENSSLQLEHLVLSLNQRREELFKMNITSIIASYVDVKYKEFVNDVHRCSNAEENIVFLKTHKTGSSTITNILNRYADLYDLMILLPLKGLNRFFWPSLFTQQSVEKIYFHRNERKANILSNHARMDKKQMEKVMKPNTKFITILRNPVKQFESTFYYFEFDKMFNFKNKNDTFSEFLQDPMKHFQLLLKQSQRVETLGLLRNGMLYDLGFNTISKKNIDIDEARKKIDKEFDIVLITEYFDESLVLLMRKFCWTFEDILYLKQNERSRKKSQISTENVNKITEWNKADFEIYKIYNVTFWKAVEKEGNLFWDDLREFRLRNQLVKQRCSVNTYDSNAHGNVININKFKVGESASLFHIPFCKKLMKSEVEYIQYFHRKYELQRKRFYIKSPSNKRRFY